MLKKYKITGVSTEGKLRFRGVDYELKTLEDSTAEFLFNNNAGFIEKVEKEPSGKKNNKEDIE